MSNKREMPYSIEAEQSVLGAILLDNDIMHIASKKLKTVDFYKDYNRIIFESMIDLYEDKKAIDIVTVTEKLKSKGVLEDIGIGYITSLSTVVPTTQNISYYIKIIKDKHTARQLIEISRGIATKLYEGEVKDVEKDIENINFTISNNKSTDEVLVDTGKVKRNRVKREYLQTGYKKLDDILRGGLRTSSLTILTGVPGAGKSTFINQMIIESIYQNNNCFLYTGELDNSDALQWFKKTVANDYHIKEFTNKQGVSYYDISDYCWELISEWIDGKFFVVDDDFKPNKNNVLAILESAIVNKGVKLIVLDNLMTLIPGNEDDKYKEQKQLCLELKQIAKKYNIAIVLVAHPKKVGNNDKKKTTPSMYDISGASEIVNLADNVIRIERVEDSKSKFMILKNRWGGIINKSSELFFDKKRGRFYTDGQELERDYGYDKNKEFVQVDIEQPFE